MSPELARALDRWRKAELIDEDVAARIRAFEESRAGAAGRLRWPTALAVAFGGLLFAAGLLLFVAAHWDGLSPAARVSLILAMVALFHVAGAFSSPRSNAFAILFHGLGTVALGAGIYLFGQTFNLAEHWPTGVLLWAVGAWAGWLLRRDWVQMTLAALLTPYWLAGEWLVRTESAHRTDRILMAGLLLLAFTYLSARTSSQDSPGRRALAWIGGLALFPCTVIAVVSHAFYRWNSTDPRDLSMEILGWVAAIGLPLAVAILLRRQAAWMNGVAALWVAVLFAITERGFDTDAWLVYIWCALGSAALAAWGVFEGRSERVNLGVAGFALTVLFFYFSALMDKLGRSASLIGLGLLFLAGGWALERTRRRLIVRARGERL
ncbi:MAG: DUF2157 domain-containing protein [Bryobacteraceae bacterium]|jgi:uncharacterized membrane protein